ncbi:MAG: hypothetical protein ACO4AU_02055 [bacterium]|jgi:membrane protein CcdC involved in cytochrome C biogenesis
MPMNLEYVLTSYGVWILAFVLYVPWVCYKLRRYREGLQSFRQNPPSQSA